MEWDLKHVALYGGVVIAVLGAVCFLLFFLTDVSSAEVVLLKHDVIPVTEGNTGINAYPVGSSAYGLQAYDALTLSENVDVPTAFLFSRKSLLPIMSQGQCGCCGAMAVCAVLASRVALSSKQAYRTQLSPQFVINCSGAVTCAEGGIISAIISYCQEQGVFPDETIPYTAQDGECQPTVESGYRVFADPTAVYKINDVNLMKRALISHGPLLCVALIDPNVFVRLGTGQIYQGEGSSFMWHAMVIIGYHQPNTDYTDAYWVVQNSWGTIWPFGCPYENLKGCGFIQMGVDTARIESYVFDIQPIAFFGSQFPTLNNANVLSQQAREVDQLEDYKTAFLIGAIAFIVFGGGLITASQVSQDKLKWFLYGIAAIVLGVVVYFVVIFMTSGVYTSYDPADGSITVQAGAFDYDSLIQYRNGSFRSIGASTETVTYSSPLIVAPVVTLSATSLGDVVYAAATNVTNSGATFSFVSVPGISKTISDVPATVGDTWSQPSIEPLSISSYLVANQNGLYLVTNYTTVTAILEHGSVTVHSKLYHLETENVYGYVYAYTGDNMYFIRSTDATAVSWTDAVTLGDFPSVLSSVSGWYYATDYGGYGSPQTVAFPFDVGSSAITVTKIGYTTSSLFTNATFRFYEEDGTTPVTNELTGDEVSIWQPAVTGWNSGPTPTEQSESITAMPGAYKTLTTPVTLSANTRYWFAYTAEGGYNVPYSSAGINVLPGRVAALAGATVPTVGYVATYPYAGNFYYTMASEEYTLSTGTTLIDNKVAVLIRGSAQNAGSYRIATSEQATAFEAVSELPEMGSTSLYVRASEDEPPQLEVGNISGEYTTNTATDGSAAWSAVQTYSNFPSSLNYYIHVHDNRYLFGTVSDSLHVFDLKENDDTADAFTGVRSNRYAFTVVTLDDSSILFAYINTDGLVGYRTADSATGTWSSITTVSSVVHPAGSTVACKVIDSRPVMVVTKPDDSTVVYFGDSEGGFRTQVDGSYVATPTLEAILATGRYSSAVIKSREYKRVV